MNIKTNNHRRQFKYRYEVPEKVIQDQFSHLSDDDIDGFIFYRDYWYHTSDFMRISADAPINFNKYNGYLSDSFFSGILINISSDGETYQIATYFS